MDKHELETLLNHAFTLFESVSGGDEDEGLLESIRYFVNEHDFDIDSLPANLSDKLWNELAEERKEAAAIDAMEDFPGDYLY